jgi:hypothetical protein
LATIDIDIDAEIAPFLELNPWLDRTLRTRGRYGAQFWVRVVGSYPARRVTSKLRVVGTTGKPISEWRGGGGHQSIVFGQHPSGIRYKFLVEAPVIEIRFAEIHWPARWGMPFEGVGSESEKGEEKHSDRRLKSTQEEPNKGGNPNLSLMVTGCSEPTLTELTPEHEKRVRAYLSRVSPAIAGARGHPTTFRLANALVHGFGLCRDDALKFLSDYNKRCDPPWSRKELEHKVDDAIADASDEGGKRAAKHRARADLPRERTIVRRITP